MFTRSSYRSLSLLTLILMLSLSSFLEPVAAQSTQTPGGAGGGALRVEGTIDLEKFVSVDGQTTWQDADSPPGPNAALGAEVFFRFLVTNRGTIALTNLSLTDNVFDASSCALPDTLAPDAFFECTIGPFAVGEGQHTDIGLATGEFDGTTVSDTDSASYFGGDQASIDVEKLVSGDGGATWEDADSPIGPRVEVDGDVSFKFVVTNNGNVPLSDISLSDNVIDVSSCTVPPTLEPGASFECVVGPLEAAEGQHTNTGTAAGTFDGVSYTDSDNANYFGGEENLPITIIIEGPVEEINVNVIVIFGFEVEVDPDDVMLTVVRVGDVVRIEGALDQNLTLDGNVVIVAITVVLVNVEVVINPDSHQAWRDEGNCGNPPPPWAPAHGWRRRCEQHQQDGNHQGEADDD